MLNKNSDMWYRTFFSHSEDNSTKNELKVGNLNKMKVKGSMKITTQNILYIFFLIK